MAFVQHQVIQIPDAHQVNAQNIETIFLYLGLMFIKIHILGKFGHYNFLSATGAATFSLNTDSGGTNGTGQQCLIYYYYLPKINGIEHNIIVRKQEPGGSNDTIDIVTNSSFNGWIKRQVSFSTVKPGYKVTYLVKACISFLNLSTVIFRSTLPSRKQLH
jgi:hypothetical protein